MFNKSSCACLLLAILIYLSWHWPSSVTGAVLACLAALCLAAIYEAGNSANQRRINEKKFFLAGCLVNVLGFYWITDTVQIFGGFPYFISFAIFLLFVVISAIQFYLFAIVSNGLPSCLGVLRLPLAWVSCEFIFPRIFPWELSTPLLAFPILTQLADIAGSYFVSFILLLFCSLLCRAAASRTLKDRLFFSAAGLLLIVCWLVYGVLSIRNYTQLKGIPVNLAMVQANTEVVQKGDIATIKLNEDRYTEISRNLSKADLIIWPEAVIQNWIHVDTGNVLNDRRIPYFGPDSNLLTGALTFETQQRFFNSAILVKSDGSIPRPYHKRILMPFGEFMPFSAWFPWLNEINKNLALFTAGESSGLFEINPRGSQNQSVKFSPLICYEDLIPRLSRESTRNGAQMLVNLSNDAWFGNSPAAIHHSMIASFRAIENKRFLIRSTNSGLTEIIDPLGRSVKSVLPNSEQILDISIELKEGQTFYTRYFEPALWWILSGFIILFGISGRFKRSE